MQKEVPFPMILLTVISNFIILHSCLHKYNPNPVPDLLMLLEQSSIPNGEKRVLIFSEEMPIPVSITLIYNVFFGCALLILDSIVIQPLGVNLRALEQRLNITCFNLFLSPSTNISTEYKSSTNLIPASLAYKIND